MQRKTISFNGQTIFVGIDVHRTTWSVTVMADGGYVKTFSQPASPKKLFENLTKNHPGAKYRAAYEAGFTGYSTYYSLTELGVECIIVNAADIPSTDRERKSKTDAIDSLRLCRCLKNGDLSGIYIMPKESLDARGVLRARKVFINQLNGYKIRIKHLLYNNGVGYPSRFEKTGTHWSRTFIKWLQDEVELLSEDRITLDLLLEQVECLRTSVLNSTRKLIEMSRQPYYKKNFDHLFSIPGIGTVTAMTILTEVVDAKRFPNERAYTKYVGFVPNCHNSGEHVSQGEMTNRGNNHLRMAYIEAAWIAVRKDIGLNASFLNYCTRMKKNEAIARIARSLCHISYAVIKKDQDYATQKDE